MFRRTTLFALVLLATPLVHAVVSVPRVAVRHANGLADTWAAADLLRQTFGGAVPFYLASLAAPAISSNVFFTPVAGTSPQICVAVDEAAGAGGRIDGVAQLVLADLRSEASDAASGRRVAFVQSVAVSPTMRRRGLGTAMVRWCEQEAARAWAAQGVEEVWLAVEAI